MTISLVSSIRFLMVLFTPLANGEAYYYSWSRFLRLSYFDHAPGVAWLSWLFTTGHHSAFEGRLAAVFLHLLMGLAVFLLAERLFSSRAGFVVLCFYIASPVVFLHSFVINPETVLGPFWVLALLLIDGMRTNREPWRPIGAGAAIGAAFLMKYTGVLLVPCALLYFALSKPQRDWWKRPSFYLGGVTALAVASPVIIWNAQHGFPTLVYHLSHRLGDSSASATSAASLFISQVAQYSPLLVPGVAWLLWRFLRGGSWDDRKLFLSVFSFPVIAFFSLIMVRADAPETHWTLPGSYALFVLAAGSFDEVVDQNKVWRWWLGICVAGSLLATLAFNLHIHSNLFLSHVPDSSYDGKSDLANEMNAWSPVVSSIRKIEKEHPQVVVAGSFYSVCGKLMEELDDDPAVYCTDDISSYSYLGRGTVPRNRSIVFVSTDKYPASPQDGLPRHTCSLSETIEYRPADKKGKVIELFFCVPNQNGA